MWASLRGLRIDAVFALVGEEYTPSTGNPEDRAREYAATQLALGRARGEIRRRLGARYVVAMTPGWHLVPGLGGNLARLPRSEVNRWRAKFVDARARIGVAGFGAFHFRFENSSEQVMRDTASGLARGLDKA